MHSSKTIWTWALVCVCCTVHTSVVLLFLWELAQLLTGQIPSSSSSCFSIQDKNLAIFASILYNRIFLLIKESKIKTFVINKSVFFSSIGPTIQGSTRISSAVHQHLNALHCAFYPIVRIYIYPPLQQQQVSLYCRKRRDERGFSFYDYRLINTATLPQFPIFLLPQYTVERERERTTFSFFSFFQCFIVSILNFFFVF